MIEETMRALLDEFIAESKTRLGSLVGDIQTLGEEGNDFDERRLEEDARASRAVKRTAGLFGFENVAELARAIEGTLALIRSGHLAPDEDAIGALLRACELIAASLDDLDREYEIDVAESVAALDDIRREHEPATATLDDLRQPLQDEAGEDVGFEVEYFALRGAVEKFTRLYKLDFELSDMTRYGKRTPVELIREALLDGVIVDARIRNMQDEFYDELPSGPLRYEVIYATNLPLDVVREKMSLEEKDVASLRVEYDFRKNDDRPNPTNS
ncbi:MAG: hypothetical protein GF419_09980 [Ignavibacteriales bacterium]|nr:hypothetical protein [Ignavibacteriales bacterium]